MSTKDLTHEALAKALADGAFLTLEQRSVLLGLVADDKLWQREADKLEREVRYLRHYGNKDCTYMADEAMKRSDLEA